MTMVKTIEMNSENTIGTANALTGDKRRSSMGTIALCALGTALIVVSLYMSQVVVAAFALLAFSFVFCSSTQIFSILFYLMPFAAIFKMGPGSTSFFTMLELWALVLFFYRKLMIDGVLITLLSALFLIAFVRSYSAISSILKLLIVVLLFYCFARGEEKQNSRRHTSFFLSGLVVSSVLGFYKERIPRMLWMYDDLNYDLINGRMTMRYSGLFQDPNYYSVALILCILLLGITLLAKRSRHRMIMSAALITLVIFGAITYSKSFLFMLVAVMLIVTLQNDLTKGAILVLSAFAIGIFLYIIDPGGIFTGIIFRLRYGDFTTGRTEIWALYLPSLIENAGAFLFGHGLDVTIGGRAQHSIFIEGLYEIGLIGSVLYAASLLRIIHISKRRIKRNLGNYFGFIIIIVMFAFINGLTSFEMPFYLMLSLMLYNCDLRSGERPI